MRRRDRALNADWGTICPLVELTAAAGQEGIIIMVGKTIFGFVAPKTDSDLIRLSRETDASPASILVARAWLDFGSFANPTWFSFFHINFTLFANRYRTVSSVSGKR
jgi:hypothetical protein